MALVAHSHSTLQYTVHEIPEVQPALTHPSSRKRFCTVSFQRTISQSHALDAALLGELGMPGASSHFDSSLSMEVVAHTTMLADSMYDLKTGK
jgi:hypothetical protein